MKLQLILIGLLCLQLATASYYPSFSTDNIAYYDFNENAGTIAEDSINELNGTLYNGTAWTTGVFGYAVDLDGTNDMIKTTLKPETRFPGNKFAISLWAKGYKSTGAIWGTKDASTPRFYVRAEALSGNNAKLRVGLNDTTYLSTSTIQDTTVWQNVLINYDNANIIIYINGVSAHTVAAVKNDFSNNDLQFGGYGQLVPATLYWDGQIDEALIFNRSLTTAEIKALYSCKTPPNGWGTWTMKANCTISGQSDTTDATMYIEEGESYTLSNTNITLGKLNAKGRININTAGGARLKIV